MANLIIKSSADNLVLKGSGGNSAITVGSTGNTTLAGTANNLGTVTAGTISTGATIATGVHGKYVLEDYDDFYYGTLTSGSTTTSSLDAINICSSNYVTVVTGASTTDLLEFNCDYGVLYINGSTAGYIGYGLQRSSTVDGSGLSGTLTTIWAAGRHAFGGGSGMLVDRYGGVHYVTKSQTVSEWGLSANTTYYVRLIGMTYGGSGLSHNWAFGGSATNGISSTGVRLTYKKWRII